MVEGSDLREGRWPLTRAVEDPVLEKDSPKELPLFQLFFDPETLNPKLPEIGSNSPHTGMRK